jgi:hypothetical protein
VVGWIKKYYDNQQKGPKTRSLTNRQQRKAVANLPLPPSEISENLYLSIKAGSTDADARSGGCALDLHGHISAGIKGFEVKRPFVRFSVRRNGVGFIDGEASADFSLCVEVYANMMKLDGTVANFLPNSKADISSGGWQKGVLEFGSVGVPRLKGFKERRAVIGSVFEMPQTDDSRLTIQNAFTKPILYFRTVAKSWHICACAAHAISSCILARFRTALRDLRPLFRIFLMDIPGLATTAS